MCLKVVSYYECPISVSCAFFLYLSGMIHAGIGATTVRSFLSTLNMPCPTENTLKKREREAGSYVEVAAKRSCSAALHREKQLTEERRCSRDDSEDEETELSAAGCSSHATTADHPRNDTTTVDIAVSTDTGWQKRGTGRNYNSLSGVGHVCGVETGQVLAVSVRNKQCRVCSAAERLGRAPRRHSCRKNWTQSAKAMEADICVENVAALNASNEGVRVSTVIGDEDSSAIHHLRSKVDGSIVKWSDVNHLKKSLGNKLYELKKAHPQLTETVIKSVQKNFAYAMTQNKADPEGLGKSLSAVPQHMFGNHDGCGSWCGYLKDKENYQHRNLPRGKDLTSPALKSALEDLFRSYSENSSKLAMQGSSQVNENFNMMVASKAPKSKHYSGSESLEQRVAAAVCEKNIGPSYLPAVCESAALSPGTHTSEHAEKQEKRKIKSQQRRQSVQYKKRRLEMKSARRSATQSSELREG